MNHRLRALSASLVLALLLGAALPAFAATPPPRQTSAVRPQGVAHVPVDEWDMAPIADDAPAGAQNLDLPGRLQPVGGDPVWQEHTFDWVENGWADVDWYKFYVTPTDISNHTCFRIEARVETNQIDPCIEVYGPIVHTAVPGFTYTDPLAMDAFPFAWYLDSDPTFGVPVCRSGSTDFVQGKDVRTPSVVFSPEALGLTSGDYYIRVRPTVTWSLTGGPVIFNWSGSYGLGAGGYTFGMQRGGFERIAGEDRADTAMNIAMRTYNVYGPRRAPTTPDANTSGNVVIANGWKSPDALAGAALCGALRAPLMLVKQDEIPVRTTDGVEMIGARHAYLLGDPNSVSNDTMNNLAMITGNSIRIWGANRYETAVNIAKYPKTYLGKSMSHLAFVVNGDKWPDALAVAPYSAWANGDGSTITPILLTKGSTLTTVTADAFATLGITDVVIVGSDESVSDLVATQIASHLAPGSHVLRLGGADRYETAMLVALWTQDMAGPGVWGNGRIGTMSNQNLLPKMTSALEDAAPSFAVATGQNYPDALAGGAMCGRLGIPLLLTPTASMSARIYDAARTTAPFNDYARLLEGNAFKHGWVFGGTNAVSAATERSLDTLVSGWDRTP